jgi:transcriptional regulator
MARENRDLLRGTVELLILRILSQGPQHGLGVARRIEDLSDRQIQLEEGSLYPALHRMEHRGLLEATWSLSENNRQAKYYRLTKPGRDRLRQESRGWLEFSSAVMKVLGKSGAGR